MVPEVSNVFGAEALIGTLYRNQIIGWFQFVERGKTGVPGEKPLEEE